jgi:hypothetical protein
LEAGVNYPNREHRAADEAARRRAVASLEQIETEAKNLAANLAGGWSPMGADARHLAETVTRLGEALTVLETLRDVREWHALDQRDAEVRRAQVTEAEIVEWQEADESGQVGE